MPKGIEIAKMEYVITVTFRFDDEQQPSVGLVTDQLKDVATVQVEASKRAWEGMVYTASFTVDDKWGGVPDIFAAAQAAMNELLSRLHELGREPVGIQLYSRLVEYPKAKDTSPAAGLGGSS